MSGKCCVQSMGKNESMLTSLGQVDDRSTHQGAEDTTLESLLANIHLMANDII